MQVDNPPINGKTSSKEVKVSISSGTDLNAVFTEINIPPQVQQLLAIQSALKLRIAEQITFAKPILTHSDHPVIYPNTIMVIQGQAGVHKSRVAENICSVFLANTNDNTALGFESNPDRKIHVLYADTERNLTDQFPYALQQIITKSGHRPQNPPKNFSFISLLEIDRTKRFTALKEFIEYERARIPDHMVIILDVITDCVQDFNKPEHTMELIDLINRSINKSNCTFICIIHENPGSEKARGHLGTEIMNKVTTALQVCFVKQDNKHTDIVELKFLKMRSNKKPDSIFCKYSDEHKGLVLAPIDEVSVMVSRRKQKSAAEEVVEHLEAYFDGILEMTSADLLERLCKDFSSKSDAMRKRLQTIIDNEIPITLNVYSYKLSKVKEGREIKYKLLPITIDNKSEE